MNKLQTHIFQQAKAGAESNLLKDGHLHMIAIVSDGAKVYGTAIRNRHGDDPKAQIASLIDQFHIVCVVAEIWGAPALGTGHANHLAPSERTDRYEGISVTLYLDGLPVANAIRRFERGAGGKPFFACDWMDTTSGRGYSVAFLNGRTLPAGRGGE